MPPLRDAGRNCGSGKLHQQPRPLLARPPALGHHARHRLAGADAASGTGDGARDPVANAVSGGADAYGGAVARLRRAGSRLYSVGTAALRPVLIKAAERAACSSGVTVSPRSNL